MKIYVLLLLSLGQTAFFFAKGQVSSSFDSKYHRYQKGQAFSGPVSQIWTDTAWQGDRLYKQIVLWSSSQVNNLTYTTCNLVGQGTNFIPGNDVTLQFGNYVIGDPAAVSCNTPPAYPPTGSGRAEYFIADALSPTPITSLNSSDPIKIWVTVNVPTGTPAGVYAGSILVKSGSSTVASLLVKILVTNAILPSVANWTYHLDIWQYPFDLPDMIQWQSGTVVTPFSSQYFAMEKPFYSLLADAGQKIITASCYDGVFRPGQTMIKWILNADSSWSFDFSNFDKYVDSLTSWGFTGQIDCFSFDGWNSSLGYYDASNLSSPSPNSPMAFTVGTSSYNAMWRSFLAQFRSHLNSKNLFSRAVLYMDEVGETVLSQVIPIIQADNASWKIGYSGRYLSAATEAALYDYSVTFGYFAGRNGDQAPGSITTFYTSCSGTVPNSYITLQNNPAEETWMSWYSQEKGLNGYLRWAYDYWTNLDPTNMQDGTNTAGDYEMIYRSGNTTSSTPLSSIRLAMLRDGIQDFQKIEVLGSSTPSLANILAQFTDNSGSSAASLVQNGQSILKQLAVQQQPQQVTPSLSNDSAIGINGPSVASIKLFPNPVHDQLQVQIPSPVTVERCMIYNSVGQVVGEYKFVGLSGAETISTQKLASGVYYISFFTGAKTIQTLKFVKNR
jgi:hypothetical protein